MPTWATVPVAFDGDVAIAGEIEVAARTWSRVPCTGFRAGYGGDRPNADGVNRVIFHDDAWPSELIPGAVAQTVLTLDAKGHIRDADIHVNRAEYRFGGAGQDLRSVLVHEMGHALGLEHSADPRATMSESGSGVRWRSLEADDVARVCALYPGVGDGGCDAIPCPAGYACIAGACQAPGDRADVCAVCNSDEPGVCEAAGDGALCVDGRCGRGCATDADCGHGFACQPAGTRSQCLSLDRCGQGPAPVVTAATVAVPLTAHGNGCSAAPEASSAWIAIAIAAVLFRRRRATL